MALASSDGWEGRTYVFKAAVAVEIKRPSLESNHIIAALCQRGTRGYTDTDSADLRNVFANLRLERGGRARDGVALEGVANVGHDDVEPGLSADAGHHVLRERLAALYASREVVSV